MTKIEFLKMQLKLALEKHESVTAAAVSQMSRQAKYITEMAERFSDCDIRCDLNQLISWCESYKNEIDSGITDIRKLQFAIQMMTEPE